MSLKRKKQSRLKGGSELNAPSGDAGAQSSQREQVTATGELLYAHIAEVFYTKRHYFILEYV